MAAEIYAHALSIEAEKRGQAGTIYTHRFKRGARITGLRDGSVRITARDGRPLWDHFLEDGKVTTFLDNPRGRRLPARNKRTGRFLKGKRRSTRRRRRSNPHTLALANPSRRRRRTHTVAKKKGTYRRRRNPAMGGNVMKLVTQGVSMAGGIVVADVTVAYLARMMPQLASGLNQKASKAGIGILLATVGPRLLGAQTANLLAQGVFAGVALDLAREFLYPNIGVNLGAYLPELSSGAEAELGAYLADGNAGAAVNSYADEYSYAV